MLYMRYHYAARITNLFSVATGSIIQEGSKLVRLEYGTASDILIRFISKFSKVDSVVSNIENLILEIRKLNPDAVEVHMGLHDRIGGIDTVN